MKMRANEVKTLVMSAFYSYFGFVPPKTKLKLNYYELNPNDAEIIVTINNITYEIKLSAYDPYLYITEEPILIMKY